MLRRRLLLATCATACAAALPACGFKLRRPPEFAFRTVHVDMPGSALGAELKRRLSSAGLQVLEAADKAHAEVDF